MNISKSAGPIPHSRRELKIEFLIYFSLIFCLGILPRTVGWVYSAIRHVRLPEHGPVARAWKDAQEITPMIFCG